MSDAHRDEIAKLEALYAEHPEGRVFTHLAEACRKAGDLDRAREVLTEGIERYPEYSSAHVVLGRVLMDLEQHDEARAEFRRVLELDNHNLVAHRSLGDIARLEGRTEDALEHYHELLELEPSDHEVGAIVSEMSEGPAVPASDAGEPSEEDEWALTGDLESEGGATEVPDAEDRPAEASPADSDAAAEVAAGEVEEPEAEGEEGVDVMTETIAQVYARQGLYDRAADVYRELVRGRPDDPELRERLAEMEEKAAAAAEPEAEEIAAEPEVEPGEPGEPAVPGIEMDDTGELTPEEESVAGFQSVEFEEADEEAVTPLAGLETQEADPETGLVGTEAGGVEDEDAGDELEPEAADETAAVDEVAEDEGVAPEEAAPWEEASVSEVDEAEGEDVEPEAIAADVEPEERPVGEAAADEAAADEAAAPWEAAPVSGDEEATEAPEPTAEVEPAADVDATADVAEPESPWTGAEWSPEAEAETPYAWAESEEGEDTTPPIRDYLQGLLDWGGASAGEGVSESDDDDDLEMFRSWLESLKQ